MGHAESSLDKSSRFQKFRNQVIGAIPRRPNTKSSLVALREKGNTDLLVVYLRWRLGYVGVRPRTIVGYSSLADDSRFAVEKYNLDGLLKAVRAGSDLTPYLSLGTRRHGFVVREDNNDATNSNWHDKDFLLCIMGFHHFHLSQETEQRGHKKRSNTELFARVTRDDFEIIGLFDHDVFTWHDKNTLTAERQRLWEAYDERLQATAAPGQIIIGGIANMGIATDGTPVAITMEAMRHMDIIRSTDPKLDDREFVRSLYGDRPIPKKIKLKWHYNHMSLGLLNSYSEEFFVLRYGIN